MNREGLTLFLCPVSLKLIQESKKGMKREYRHPSVDNTVNDLHDEIQFENARNVRSIAFLFETKIYFILGDRLHFFAEADTKKHRYASARTSNTALVKLIESAKMIM